MKESDHWPLAGDEDLRDGLLEAWRAPHRGYHNELHLKEVCYALDLLNAHEDFDPVPVYLAAWFHDAVYEGERDDEERSAAWAFDELNSRSHLQKYADEVVRLVSLTVTHKPEPDDINGAVLMDADLAILAAPPERYASYVAGVRVEYKHYDDKAFQEGRRAVLENLLSGALFHTEQGERLWEERARINLKLELEGLELAHASQHFNDELS